MHMKKTEGMPPGPVWMAYLDHTADVAISVKADDLPTLFSRAAWGMFHTMVPMAQIRESTSMHIKINADDRAALMVRWLSELNFIHQTQHMVFSRFDVTSASDNILEADVRGEKIDPARHTVAREIKAVTYHCLKVEKTKRGWVAEILFDI